jgi:hypothetical protein
MQRFSRNRQPTLFGHTNRIDKEGKSASSELQYAREQVMAGCERAGTLMAHWRRYTPEFNNGRCPTCYNPRTKTPVDDNCPVCYGTGFEGGFATPVVQNMIILHSDRRLEATETGFVRLHRLVSRSPYIPNIAVGDVIGEIKNMEGEYVTDDRYLVEQGVEKQRFRLASEFVEPDTYDHLDPESEVFAYKFEASRIPKPRNPQDRVAKYDIPFENMVWLARKIGGG